MLSLPGNTAGLEDPTPQKINKGIGSEGLSCILSGIFGGVGTTSYSENIGLVGITGVASRYVVGAGAVILIVLSLLGKLGAVIATIPSPVIGGAYIALFGLIGSIGIMALSRADLTSQRNLIIVGLSLLLGLGLPAWIGANPLVFEPRWIADVFTTILSTGMAVGAICGLILDNLLPGTLEERGVKS
ncbi:uracil permease [Candidatus Hakubella thermalkaliphila]|uniref:Putative pyrimidine permease RutG n=1 Tax=Candidatus Hakubella thermalkaliphila TaxID=2754717 RepID=A0A6V8PQD1_9ACTN|nr:solute carrier family 23 protein [Candidatus Hakubella thermalkaliphila]GFP24615.1 putative pyrimidine permease RutG [Candidatus Hakubella thermalkaliphila]GFP27483.1 uracil permease [Candidatus Hakubella thermalkaliphila]GFP34538.1 uracil permease [Candidatus Hakubella thermalkaliphila]GFP41472.1 uracil permease [Candidatus Hakubella thermalkaliphila]